MRRRCRYRPCDGDGRAVETGAATRVAATLGDFTRVEADRRHTTHHGRRRGRSCRLLGAASTAHLRAKRSRFTHPTVIRLTRHSGSAGADFLATLVHGPELSTVTVLLSTPEQISNICGQDAVACYNSRGARLYAPGEDPGSDLSAEAVITHEYGHHIAANRSNAPWLALDWGPKRWASAMQVCAKARQGVLVPGAEDAVQYTENPGEGWAEGYRVLNEHKAGRPETPWQIVDQALYPTAAALTAAEQDVTTPWETGTTDDPDRRPDPHEEDQDIHGLDPTRRQLADVSENVRRDARFR